MHGDLHHALGQQAKNAQLSEQITNLNLQILALDMEQTTVQHHLMVKRKAKIDKAVQNNMIMFKASSIIQLSPTT